MQRSVDSGNRALTSCFFVTGGSVYLSGKEKSLDDFRLQRMLQLGWVEVIVLDGVTWSVDLRISQCRDFVECIQLDIHRHAG